MTSRDHDIIQLRRSRPRNHMLSASVALLVALAVYSWMSTEMHLGDIFSLRRIDNARRFLAEIVPYPLHGKPFDVSAALAWAGQRMADGGWQAAAATLAISIAAIVLAGLVSAVLCLLAARNIAAAQPFVASPRLPSLWPRSAAAVVVVTTRASLIFVRAVPEYIWAFLLISIFGFSAWPAVLALAIHNTGILGKLMAETVEHIEPKPARALRALGAGRAQIALSAVLPEVLPRFLLYFFYRWESCLREATVLGMLGVVSLGSLVRDARAANFYDEMTFYILIGAALVMLADLASALARRLGG